MKWFKHDSGANMDAKLQEVLLDYGLEGYGLYWYCIELIALKVDKDNITFSLEHDARVIARNTGSTVQKVEEMMRAFVNHGLFENSDGRITCLKLARRLDDSTSKNPQIKELLSRMKGAELLEKNPKPVETLEDSPKDSEDIQNDSEEIGKIPNDSERVGEGRKKSGQIRLDKIRLDKNKKYKGFDLSDFVDKFEENILCDYIDYRINRDEKKTLQPMLDDVLLVASSPNKENFSPNELLKFAMGKGWKSLSLKWVRDAVRDDPDLLNRLSPSATAQSAATGDLPEWKVLGFESQSKKIEYDEEYKVYLKYVGIEHPTTQESAMLSSSTNRLKKLRPKKGGLVVEGELTT